MIKWGILGIISLIAWAMQAWVNEHDRLSGQVFEALNFQNIYLKVAGRYLEAGSGEVEMGVMNFRIRVVSHLKDQYSHRQLKYILKLGDDYSVAALAETKETREAVKVIAEQVAKSYAAMLRRPDADVSTRRRRRR